MINIGLYVTENIASFVQEQVKQLLDSEYLDYDIIHLNKDDVNDKHLDLVITNHNIIIHSSLTLVITNENSNIQLLKKCRLMTMVKEEFIESEFMPALKIWLDYYFKNYHFALSEMNDFFFSDIAIIEKTSEGVLLTKMNGERQLIKMDLDFFTFGRTIPHYFMAEGDFIYNIHAIVNREGDHLTLMNQKEVVHANTKQLESKLNRFEIKEDESNEVGDVLDQHQIKKALLLTTFISTLASLVMLMFSIYLVPVVFLIVFMTSMNNFFKLGGYYYRFNENGFGYTDTTGFFRKFRYIIASYRHRIEDMLEEVGVDDVSYIRIASTKSMNIFGARYGYIGAANYRALVKFELSTKTLEYQEFRSFMDLIQVKELPLPMIHFLNELILEGKEDKSKHPYLIAINDPNATLQQFASKLDWIDHHQNLY